MIFQFDNKKNKKDIICSYHARFICFLYAVVQAINSGHYFTSLFIEAISINIDLFVELRIRCSYYLLTVGIRAYVIHLFILFSFTYDISLQV